ncbi:hypothetical protein M431DRAFT_193831 [Trichoderma harzianum CBS 226.95]|uniref:Uncharacterized protein n=1 Tax=Trichoderma harzianum CBS 226.95 TaxID=983964 RepID=A0A2T4AUH0_TRIHA|nr:hypothetical protein M431DRAFT_193831 [Trichoderma harzianum CBS 226.95]PTB60691.1 hypothetical protein M431DRAFT_193831 [Trichoderma harzianum CBS 226.95]
MKLLAATNTSTYSTNIKPVSAIPWMRPPSATQRKKSPLFIRPPPVPSARMRFPSYPVPGDF